MYDIRTQRISAINTLKAKKRIIKNDVKAGRYMAITDPCPDNRYENLYYSIFRSCCHNVRAFGDAHWQSVQRDEKSIIVAALAYVKLEVLIDRLKKGEDPRQIIFEVIVNS